MAVPHLFPFHADVARYAWRDQFFICPLAAQVDSDPTLDELRAFIRMRGGRKVGLNILLSGGAKPPSAEQLARTRRAMAEMAAGVSHTATAILGAGFFASVFLGIAGTMIRLRPTTTPRLVTQQLAQFSQFVALHSAEKPTSFEVLSATNWILHDLRGREPAEAMRATG